MFKYNDLENYEEEFEALEIKDKEEMLGILNTLDAIAEITYNNFKFNRSL